MLCNQVKISKMRYLGYAVFAQAKRMLGLGSNRKFLVWKLIKLINDGLIDTNNISVTSIGRTDGVGAQAIAKFTAMCFAEAYNAKYVHAPFESLAHAELSPELWTESWERLLNMSIGGVLLDEKKMQVVKLETYLEDPTLWTKKVVIADLHFHAFCELEPTLGSEVSKKLRSAINVNQLPDSASNEFVIGVHVRRGDVRKGDRETGHRFTENKHVISVLEQVLEVVSGLGYNPKIHLHTNGTAQELEGFSKLSDITYHAGKPALETFISLVKSNVLISARSDFSMLAGIYCKGIVICDPSHRTPLREWIKAGPNCTDIGQQLKLKLNER